MSVHDDMAAAGQASWPDAVATYHEAIRHHPAWVRGVRRAAEIILSEHGVADSPAAPYSYSDALSVMDALIDRIIAEPDYFGRSCSTKYGGPVQCQFLNLQWIYGSSESVCLAVVQCVQLDTPIDGSTQRLPRQLCAFAC